MPLWGIRCVDYVIDSRFFPVVPDDVVTAFSGADDVFPAVAVEVVHADLQADTRAFAGNELGVAVVVPAGSDERDQPLA